MVIPISKTNLLDEEIQEVLEPLRSGWLVQGPKVKDFEYKWAEFIGVDQSIAVSSCTSAMQISLEALGFGRGDEAIVPAFTWVSTANVVEKLGGKVVFCDIDLKTFNLDVNQIQDKVTNRTKVIMPVHLFGYPANMDPILEIAKKNNLFIVEDAACGFGAKYKGNHVGTFGDVGCFSFHPRKAITTGEGGMITTFSHELAEKIRRLRDHGAAVTDLQRHLGAQPYLLADHPEAGYNQRMTDLQGALGSAQMDRAHQIVNERCRLASRYDAAFAELDWLLTPVCTDGFEHGYQSYACLFQPQPVNITSINQINNDRNSWMADLQKHGISTRPATHAVHMLSFYKNKYQLCPEDFPSAYAANHCSISLPLFHGMTEEEQDYIISVVLNKNIT